MIVIDGSLGEGGGQIIRTALALSMITQRPFEINNIRAGRPKPGLRNQHLTAINAAQQICQAQVDGSVLNSKRLVFIPGQVYPGSYYFDIGTAGSTTLVLQTILYALLKTTEPSFIKIKGGTHNPFAPTVDFIEHTFIPALKHYGIELSFKTIRPGFYPKGGGQIEVQIMPLPKFKPAYLNENQINSVAASILISSLPGHIAQREKIVLQENLKELTEVDIVETKRALSPGNAVHLFAKGKTLTETFCQLGKVGVKAEEVAKRPIEAYKKYRKSGAVVGEYLADQLLIPLALTGKGCFTTTKPSQHTLTNIETIRQFIDVNIELSPIRENLFMVELA